MNLVSFPYRQQRQQCQPVGPRLVPPRGRYEHELGRESGSADSSGSSGLPGPDGTIF